MTPKEKTKRNGKVTWERIASAHVVKYRGQIMGYLKIPNKHAILGSDFIYLFSRLYDVSTSFCAHLTIILSCSSICLCHFSLLPLIHFPPSVL